MNENKSDITLNINSAVHRNSDDATAKNRTIAVIGGDARILAAATNFASRGYEVSICGFGDTVKYPKGTKLCRTVDKALADATMVLLPLPTTRDGYDVWCPLDPDNRITLDEVERTVAKETRVFGGKLPHDFIDKLKKRGVLVTDYYSMEEIQVYNAYITAEGALMYAMKGLDRTIKNARIAVLGYGRIGHFLTSLLLSLGADVTVLARRCESRAWAESEGARTLPIDQHSVQGLCRGYNVIFNTVPSVLIDTDILSRMSRDTLIIELASTPGGIDSVAARHFDVKVVWASSIPGKYAPVSSGEVIGSCVLSLLEKDHSGGAS